jgi:hypothetical protein
MNISIKMAAEVTKRYQKMDNALDIQSKRQVDMAGIPTNMILMEVAA